jgi:hypothetical protein
MCPPHTASFASLHRVPSVLKSLSAPLTCNYTWGLLELSRITSHLKILDSVTPAVTFSPCKATLTGWEWARSSHTKKEKAVPGERKRAGKTKPWKPTAPCSPVCSPSYLMIFMPHVKHNTFISHQATNTHTRQWKKTQQSLCVKF